jgi:hypothetical protein
MAHPCKTGKPKSTSSNNLLQISSAVAGRFSQSTLHCSVPGTASEVQSMSQNQRRLTGTEKNHNPVIPSEARNLFFFVFL